MARRTPPPIEQVRLCAVWRPTAMLFDSSGKERVRLEGYVPNRDFNAWLRGGVGRLALVQKKFADAERWYDQTQRGREADGLQDEASAEP
jgi:hypothetical protein